MRKPRLRIVLFILLTPIVLLCAFLLFERIRGQISLARYKRELIAKGEKLTFKELIPPVPEGVNGAPAVYDAIKRLSEEAVFLRNWPPAMRPTPSGHAIVGFREKEWVYDKVTNNWEEVAVDLKVNEATLAEIKSALAKPVLNNDLDYTQGFRMRTSHLSPPKSATFWYRAASQLALHENNCHNASSCLIPQIQLPRLLAEDRIIISELVRIAIAAISKTTTWESLQADGWTDGDLAKLQEAWQNQNFVAAMARSFEGERALAKTSYEQVRRSNEDAVKKLFWQEESGFFWPEEEQRLPWWHWILSKEAYCKVWRFVWSHQDERHYLKQMQSLIEVARRAVDEKSYVEILPLVEKWADELPNRNYYDELRFPASPESLAALSRVLNRAMRAETDRSITVCAVALKRYSIRHGKYPVSLNALVPEFLSFVPIDYMNGKPMKYRLNADGSFTLYSVGEDGKDDAGDASLLPDKKSYRSLWDRKDFIWPAPATPEEVEAWRKETDCN